MTGIGGEVDGRDGIEGPTGSLTGATGDAVENALATALTAAATAGRYDVVATLARELEARRLARAGNVVDLMARRASR